MDHRYSCAFLLVSVLAWMQVEACGGTGSPITMQLTIDLRGLRKYCRHADR